LYVAWNARKKQDDTFGTAVAYQAECVSWATFFGISVNIAVFIPISSVVLHPFPYPRLERLMTVWETVPKADSERGGLAPADFVDFQNDNRSFEQLTFYREWDANVTGTGNPERVEACLVSPTFFSVLGSKAAIGRTPDVVQENAASESREVVISEGFWKTRLAASPSVVGRTISLNKQRYTIVGVMPDRFDYPLGTEIWSPLALGAVERHRRDSRALMVVGLLKALPKGRQEQKPGQSREGWSAETAKPMREEASPSCHCAI
jgi:hypothetical protein